MTETTPHVIEFKRATLTKDGSFSGLASTWDGEADSQGDTFKRDAFLNALAIHKRNNTLPALLWSHDQDQPIGRWLEVYENAQGLYVSGQLTLSTTKGAEAYELIKDGAMSLSVGFVTARGGARLKNGIREIHNVDRLHEISVVAIPANSQAKILSVKSSPRDFEKAMYEMCGLSRREAKRACSSGYGGLVRNEQFSELQAVNHKLDRLTQLIERGNT